MTVPRTKIEIVFVAIVLIALFVYSFPTLTTKPKLFFDEGFVIEEARNFSEYGVLDTITAPNTFSGLPHIASSIGFSDTVPLAALFSVFGFSVELARSYALVWMVAFLVLAYVCARRYFGSLHAFLSLLLIATFPPFHGNGRMVMGDVPGFAYLLAALLLEPLSTFGAGLFLGLSLVARPSLYIVAVLSFVALLVYKYKKDVLRPLLKLGAGIALSVAASFALYYPGWLHSSWWEATLSFLRNPSFGATTPLENALSNMGGFLSETTLMYLAALTMVIVAAYLCGGKNMWDKRFVFFSALYGSLMFLYFLRSPGWFKYLLPLQLLIFLFLPSALQIVAEHLYPHLPRLFARFLKPAVLTVCAVVTLVVLHAVQLVFFADIFASRDAQDTVAYVSETVPHTSTIAFIHAPQVAMFFPAERKYSFFGVNESLSVGENPLDFSEDSRADIIVAPHDGLPGLGVVFDEEHVSVLRNAYEVVHSSGRFDVYQLR